MEGEGRSETLVGGGGGLSYLLQQNLYGLLFLVSFFLSFSHMKIPSRGVSDLQLDLSGGLIVNNRAVGDSVMPNKPGFSASYCCLFRDELSSW